MQQLAIVRSFTLNNNLLSLLFHRNGTLDGVVLGRHTDFSPVPPKSESETGPWAHPIAFPALCPR